MTEHCANFEKQEWTSSKLKKNADVSCFQPSTCAPEKYYHEMNLNETLEYELEFIQIMRL